MIRITKALQQAGCALLLGLAVATCRDDPTGPGQRASLALAPVLPAQALNLAAFGLTIDSLRVIIVRPPGDTVINTAVAFAVDQDSVALQLELDLEAETETFDVTLQLSGGGFVLFSATTTVEVTAGQSGSNDPVEIGDFAYTGPGAGITHLVVSPEDSVIQLSDSLRFRVDAFNVDLPVTQFYVTWSTSNETLAPINAHGVLLAPNLRGAVQVIATTPNGIADTVPVTFVPVPVSIVPVGPIPADVAPGSLIGPLRARVLAADGFGVKGIPVTFTAVSGGGSVTNALVVSDTGGYVETPATAGSGPLSLYTATVAGIATPATFNVSILTQTGTQLAFTFPPAGAVVDLPFSVLVEVRDAQGIVVPGATDPVTIAFGANPGGATLGGTLTVNAVQGVAVFGDLTINQPDSGYTLVVTAPGLAPDTTPPFSVIPAFTGRLWTNPAGGNWSDPANWSGGIVPGVGDTVFVTLDGDYTVTLDADVSVGMLFLGGSSGVQTLAGVSRTLQVDSALEVFSTGVVQLTNGTLAGTGGFLFNAGQLYLQAVTVAHSVFNSAGSRMTARGFVRLSGDFLNSADALVTIEGDPLCCTATLEVEGSSFSNGGQVVLTAVNSGGTTASLQVSNAPAFNLPGGVIAVLPGSGGARELNLDLQNAGTVQVDADATLSHTSADHDNSGTIQLNGGNLTITQAGVTPSFTTSGSIVVGAGRVLSVSGGAFAYANAVPGGLAGLGGVSFTGVTLDLGPDFVHDSLGLSLVNSTVNGPGTLTNAAGRTLSVQQTAINAPFVNQGTFVVRGASDLNGTITAAATGTIRVEGDPLCCVATLTTATGFTNDGLIELTSVNSGGTTATLAVTSGTLVNAAGGTIAALLGTGGARELQAQLSNDGTLLVAHDLSLNRAGADHLNSGVISLTSGNLVVEQTGGTPTLTTLGSIVVGAGRTLTVNGGTLQYSNATPGGLSGLGGVVLNGAVLGLNTDLAHDTLALSLLNATVNGPGTLSVAPGRTLFVQTTTINAPFLNQGGFTAKGATALNGAITSAPGSGIVVLGDPFCCVATLSVPGGFTNHGLIELTAINTGGTTATLDVPSGFLVNAADGSIALRAGTGGARVLAAAINNQGGIFVEQDGTLDAASADHVNSGSIVLSSGSLTLNQGGTTPTFTTTGAVVVGAGRTLQVNGGAFNYANAAPGGLAGLGTVAFTGATLNLTPGLGNDSLALSFLNSTVNGAGVLSNAAGRALAIQQTALNAPFVNQGLLVARGASTLGGSVTAGATGTIRLEGDPFCCVATLTVANPLTNDGLIELTAINPSGTTATLDVPGGVTNATGGTIAVLPGSGGARGITAPITNHGTITVATAATIGTANASHVNNGTIDVTGGTLDVPLTGSTPAFTNQGMLTVGGGATVAVTGGAAGSFTNAATGTLAGGGTVDVSATSFTNDGTVAPGGSPGALTFVGNYPMSASAVMSVEIGGTTPGTQYDQIVVTGNGALTGTLNVTLINGFTPAIGQVFTIVSGANIAGLPVSVNLPSVAGAVWLPSVGATGLQLSLLSASALLPVQWIAGSGNWSDGLNWSTGAPPGPGDSAIINVGGPITVTVDANATAAFLDIGTAVGGALKTLSLASPTLTLTTGGIVGGDGAIDLTGGTLTGGGALQVNGDVNWTGGTISGAGFVLISPTGTLALSGTGSKNLNSRKIQTVGTVTWNGTGAINSGGGAELRVQSGGTFAVDGDASWLHNLGGAQPRLTVEAGGTLSRSTGTGVVALSVPLDNAGSVQVNAGTLELRGGAATGSFALAAGTQLDFPSATYSLGDGAAISGAGRARIVGGTVSVDGAGPVPLNRLVLQAGSLLGAGALEIQDSLLWSGGAMSGSGLTSVPAGADLVISGNVTLSARTIVNGGAITWTAGTISSGNGAAVQNSAGALLDLRAAASWFHNQGGTVPVISNSPGGVVQRSTSAGLADLRALVNNAGTLQVLSGTLGLNGGGTSGGAFTAAPGTELGFSGTHILPVNSSITAGGTVSFGGGTTTVGGSYDVSGQTLINGGNVAFDGPDTARIANLVLQSGTLGGAGVVAVQGAGTWSGGTLGGPGVLRIPAGVTLNVTGAVSFTERTLANAGQISWSAGNINSGLAAVVNNESGAVFDVQGTGSWFHNLGGATPQVNNLVGGTLRRSASPLPASFHVPVANAGTLDVQSGTVVLNSGAVNSGAHLVNAAATLQYGAGTHSMTTGAQFGGLGRVLLSTGATMSVDAAVADTVDARWIELAGGSLTGTGTLRVLDSLVWTAGALGDAGVLHVPAGALLELRGAASKIWNARTIANAGVVSWIGTGLLASGNDATLLNESGGTFQLESDADWLHNQGGAIPHIDNLAGGLIKRGGATSAITVGAALNNDGTLDLQTGSVTFTGGGSSKGGFLLSAPGTLAFGGGSHVLDVGSAVSGNGGFHVSAGTMTLNGDYNATGTTRISGGTAEFNGSKPAEVTTLDLSGGSLGGVGQVNLHGAGTWTGGAMTGTGLLRVLAGAALTLDGAGAKVFTQRTILNSAVVTWKGTGILSSGGSAVFTNEAGATLELQGDAQWANTQGGTSTLNNAGSIKRNSATGTVSIQTVVNNDGSVDVTSGTLSLAGGGASSGIFGAAAGSVLDFGGGTHTLSGPTSRVNGTGLVNFSAGNITLSGTALNAYDVTGVTQILSPAVVNFNTTDSVRMTTLQLRGGSMNGSAPFAIRTTGLALWTGGGMSGPAGSVLRIPDKAALNIGGSATKAFTGRRILVEGGATANWTLGNVNAISGATLDVQPSGVFNVSAAASWSGSGTPVPLMHINDRANVNVTTAGTTTLPAGMEFRNQGTLDIAAGATLKVGADLNQLAGSTLQGDGVLDVGGNSKVVNQGTTRPGTNGPGILTIVGAWPQPLGSTVVIDVWGPTLGSQYDQLKIIGASTPLGASLQVVGDGSYQPTSINLNPVTWSGLPIGVYTVTYFNIPAARTITHLATGLVLGW